MVDSGFVQSVQEVHERSFEEQVNVRRERKKE